MKKYKNGIIIGLLSILSSLIVVGIPIGSSILEIINIIIYIIGLLAIIYFGFIKKNDKYLLVFSFIYLILLIILAGIIEVYYKDYNIMAIGFIIGLLFSIIGIINSNRNKDGYNISFSIGINIIALIISVFSFLMIFINGEGIINDISNCDNITGGGYNIYFDTNSNISISSMHVCIACPPDSYEELPIPSRDDYSFMGWYYDKELTKEVSTSSTIDISPVPNKDKNGCLIGYKDIVLYAKWRKIKK